MKFTDNIFKFSIPGNSLLFLGLILFSTGLMAQTPKSYLVKSPEEFNAALAEMNAGGNIVIANGTYKGWDIYIKNKGTAIAPIQIKAQEAGKVIFTGDVYKATFTLVGNYIELNGLSFNACNVIGLPTGSQPIVKLENSNNCKLTACIFEKNVVKRQYCPILTISGNASGNSVSGCKFISNVDNQDIQVRVTDKAFPVNTLIDNNIFTDKAKVSWANGNGGECVQIGQDNVNLGTRSVKATVSNNRFIHCNAEAEVVSNKCSDNKYINNYFENCDGELVLRGGHNCLVENNKFESGAGGIRVYGSEHIIINNMMKNIPVGIKLGYGMSKGKIETGFYVAASDCQIKDNQIYYTGETGILVGNVKNKDWSGKFNTEVYPSRVYQDVPPIHNVITNNIIIGKSATPILIKEAPENTIEHNKFKLQ